MIQRKQTLWLLLSLICATLTFKFPFYNGTISADQGVQGAALNATYNIFLLLLTIVTIVLAIVAIFTFKNRKLQVQLTFVGLIFSVGLIALYFWYSQAFEPGGQVSLTALLMLGVVAGFFFAIKGIRSDQKLIRDLNRLR